MGVKIDAQRILSLASRSSGIGEWPHLADEPVVRRYHLSELVVQYAMRTPNYGRSHGDISSARLPEMVAEINRMLPEKQDASSVTFQLPQRTQPKSKLHPYRIIVVRCAINETGVLITSPGSESNSSTTLP